MTESEPLIESRPVEITTSFDEYIRPILAEFIGVTLFVFVGCLALNSGNIVAAAIGHGFTIALLIMALGEISGGHFNPAVTVGATLAGALKPALAFGYFVGQMFGGILGAALVRGVLPTAEYKNIKGGVHHLSDSVEPGWGLLIEAILTFVLVFTVIMAAINPKTKSQLAPLAIGFAVTVDIMAGGGLTGASMNPARAFGPALCSTAIMDDAWDYHYIYWLGPIPGAVVAAVCYMFFFAVPNKRFIARIQTLPY